MAASLEHLREGGRMGGRAARIMQQAATAGGRSQRPAGREDRGMVIMSASWKTLSLQILLLLVSCRHTSAKTPGPTTASPQVALNPLLTLERSVVLEGASKTEKVELLHAITLELECIWTGNNNNPPNVTGFWTKGSNEIDNSRVTVPQDQGRYSLRRVFNIASEENLGNYSCAFGSEAKVDFVLAAPQLLEVPDKPIISYVRDTVVIACKLDKDKPKPSSWKWYKANDTGKVLISPDAEHKRYKIKSKEMETKLYVHDLSEADSGFYHCGAVYPVSTVMSHVQLKVITFYEPLKPFLAIVIEVVILVAVILLYEKIWSKKKGAEEERMDDPENTMTLPEENGSEGSSSMRQRKV